MAASITLTNAHPSQRRDIISSYLLSATIERNPEPRYAENDGAGGEEDRTNNVRTRIALATCLDGSAIKSIKNRKSIPFRFFSSAIVVRMFTPGTLPLFRESSLRQGQQSASSFVIFPPAPRPGDRKSLDRGEVGFRHLFFAATRACASALYFVQCTHETATFAPHLRGPESLCWLSIKLAAACRRTDHPRYGPAFEIVDRQSANPARFRGTEVVSKVQTFRLPRKAYKLREHTDVRHPLLISGPNCIR